MKIAYFTNYITYHTGGPRFLMQIAEGMAQRGHEVAVITGATYDRTPPNIKVVDLRIYRGGLLPYMQPLNVIRYLRKATSILRDMGDHYDVVHTDSHFPNLLPLLSPNKTPKVCSIYHFESPDVITGVAPRVGLPLVQLAETNSTCTAIHVLSRSVKRQVERLRLLRNPIYVIPPGIYAEKYRKYTRRPEEGLYLMVGRLEPRKHYDHAIAAFRIVKEVKPNYRLLIVGDGPQRAELEKLIKRLGLERTVHLLGRITEEEKLDLMSRAAALIHLGYPEGFGIAILEAIAMGTPVITYDIPPLNELAIPDVTGIVIPKDDVMTLAKTILEFDLQKYNESRLRNLAQRFDIENIIKQFEKLYYKLIEKI
ncbi:glycosyltransferase family 4 protein [Pyrobaculum neutrophilum]|uniref:Glycosyl transferase group 1 n=1 Tax=Pyrobaculum neutrophilum (strain DSM 2338 / JCM 9278 / NBRC 100436 / V24Sta) TaxID=444157 RepID=B1YCB9_PYRNV|nr:glycosyltransferase family 4 protein [Pyrobaculum neutrophilum]ACB39432.1 glycosyl transferase group 1 [Pyrobaculum neutrophilum V24Sta]